MSKSSDSPVYRRKFFADEKFCDLEPFLALGEEEKANSYFDTFINEENNIDEYGDLWLHVCEHYLKLFSSWKSQQDISGLDIIMTQARVQSRRS